MNKPQSQSREERWRKPGASGVPIVLGDGAEWLFPKPKLGIRAALENGRVVFKDKTRRSFGPEYEALVDAYVEADDGLSELNALIAAAVDLLGRNYDLTPGELAELLPKWFDDEDNEIMWRAIADLVLGRSPKPTPVGSGARSSPTG